LQAGRRLDADPRAVRSAVGALQGDRDVAVVEDADVTGREPDDRRAAGGLGRGTEQDAAAQGEGGRSRR
jgi:hypothetical protein